MEYILLVEGNTEKLAIAGFLKKWLDPKLSQPVKIKTDNLKGFGNFKKGASKKARKHLKGPDRDRIIGVIGLLDLYGPQHSNFFPPDKTSIKDRYDWGVDYFKEEVNHAKFRMFFAVHELEAWILSQPGKLPRPINAKLANDNRDPETINFQEPPSKLLNKLYQQEFRNKDYKKTVDSKNLLEKLDPQVAYNRCPYLKKMLDEMLEMARGA